MTLGRTELAKIIIQKKLQEDVEQITSIVKQGFDVYAHSDFTEIRFLLSKSLEQRLQKNFHQFHIFLNRDEFNQRKFNKKSNEMQSEPLIWIGEESPDHGYGFVHYKLQSPDQLIGNVAVAVQQILKYFCLQIYLETFEASVLTKLKNVARVHGLRSLIDAVVQTAYLAGFKGQAQEAQEHLDLVLVSTQHQNEHRSFSTENCAKVFLSHAVAHGENAYSFLKSCLGYHIINHHGYNMSRASQVLNVSRTTLQEHLKMAQELQVSAFFEGRLPPPL